MMLTQLPRPIIFAHRGASAHAPENTLAAFTLALHQGADAIELDAKLSIDGQVIVMHDQSVDRTTDSAGAVNNFTLAELRKMDAGSHFDITYQGEPIPTLDEVFKAVGQMTFINVELTNYDTPKDDLPFKVAALVRKHRLTKRVVFSSFHPIPLRRIHRLIPEAPIGLLARSGSKGALARSWIGRLLLRYDSLNPDLRDVTQGLVDQAHRHHKFVLVYTVNQPEDMQRLFEMGVDGIFTDDPELARGVLMERSGAAATK